MFLVLVTSLVCTQECESQGKEAVDDFIINSVDAQNIRSNLRYVFDNTINNGLSANTRKEIFPTVGDRSCHY